MKTMIIIFVLIYLISIILAYKESSLKIQQLQLLNDGIIKMSVGDFIIHKLAIVIPFINTMYVILSNINGYGFNSDGWVYKFIDNLFNNTYIEMNEIHPNNIKIKI